MPASSSARTTSIDAHALDDRGGDDERVAVERRVVVGERADSALAAATELAARRRP